MSSYTSSLKKKWQKFCTIIKEGRKEARARDCLLRWGGNGRIEPGHLTAYAAVLARQEIRDMGISVSADFRAFRAEKIRARLLDEIIEATRLDQEDLGHRTENLITGIPSFSVCKKMLSSSLPQTPEV